MQKLVILIFSLFATIVVHAQQAVVIDNTKEHRALFDAGNPYSLVSFLMTNGYDITPPGSKGMTPVLAEQLSQDPRNHVILVKGGFTAKEGERYVHHRADSFYIMIEDIDRIVLELSDKGASLLERVNRISFYKKIDGVYHSVYNAPANEMFHFDAFRYCRKLDENLTAKLLADNPNSLWNVMRKEAMNQLEKYDGSSFYKWKYDLKLNYFVAAAHSMGWFLGTEDAVHMEDWRDGQVHYVPQFVADDPRFPFEMNLHKFQKDSTEKEIILSGFDAVHFGWEKTKKPIEDYDSTTQKFVARTVQNPDGTASFVFPPPEKAIFWIEYKPMNVYVLESFHGVDGTSVQALDNLYFTTEVNGQEEMLGVIVVNEEIESYLTEVPNPSLVEMDFYEGLTQAFENEELRFDLKNPKVRERLKFAD